MNGKGSEDIYGAASDNSSRPAQRCLPRKRRGVECRCDYSGERVVRPETRRPERTTRGCEERWLAER